MAGYFISSIDAELFDNFVAAPNDKQLKRIASVLSAENCHDLPQNDPLRKFNEFTKAQSLDFLKSRLNSSDWYSDLSPSGRTLWERCVCDACETMDSRPEIEESVYWWVWDMISEAFGCENDGTIDPDIPFSAFGTKPFRYIQGDDYDPGNRIWVPFHSLHGVEDVNSMADELDEIEDTSMTLTMNMRQVSFTSNSHQRF